MICGSKNDKWNISAIALSNKAKAIGTPKDMNPSRVTIKMRTSMLLDLLDVVGRGEERSDVLRSGRRAQSHDKIQNNHHSHDHSRSEERRVGTECVSKGRSRWSPNL